MGRSRTHNEDTRSALLDAAEQLIEQHGPAALSVRAVSDAVGTTTRAVYSTFGSKDGLLESLAARLFEFIVSAIDSCRVTDDPVADVIEASVNGFRRTALEHRALYSLVFHRSLPDLKMGGEFEHFASIAFNRLVLMMTRIKDHGMLRNMDAAQAALALHALTEGLASIEIRDALSQGMDAEKLWRNSLSALIEGM